MKKLNKYISIFIILGLTNIPSFADEYKSEDQVYHVVLVWLKTYRNEMRINKLLMQVKNLKISRVC